LRYGVARLHVRDVPVHANPVDGYVRDQREYVGQVPE
jgi:hypothetical protein